MMTFKQYRLLLGVCAAIFFGLVFLGLLVSMVIEFSGGP